MSLKLLSLDPSMSNFGICEATIDPVTMKYDVTNLTLSSSPPTKDKRIRRNSDDLERCRRHADHLRAFMADTDVVVCEIPQGSQSARAMASYGACVGLLSWIDKPLIQVTPTQVKVAATGSKTASKKEIINWATALFPDANWIRGKNGSPIAANEHLADAVAVIQAAIKSDDFKMICAMFNKAVNQ